MRILYGITKSNWGGAQRYVYDLALASKEAGHEVSVLAGGNGVLIERLKEAGVRVIALPYMGRDVRFAAEAKGFIDIYKTLRLEKPDVFHINSSKMGALGALAARLARIPKIIFTAHGWAFNEPRHWLSKLVIEEISWLTVLLSHKTICVSEAIRRDMERKPFTRSRLTVIKHGVEDFKQEAKKPHENLIIGTISELHKVKGLDVAIRGFARAFKYTDALFEIIGDGDERDKLLSLARELGVENHIKFLGFRERAREMLAGFDIFVLASRSEALGYVLLEAGIAGLPVIATRVGGIPEIIKDGSTGLLVSKDDPQALSEALKKLAGDRGERDRLGDNLRQLVRKDFSKGRMLGETLSLYR